MQTPYGKIPDNFVKDMSSQDKHDCLKRRAIHPGLPDLHGGLPGAGAQRRRHAGRLCGRLPARLRVRGRRAGRAAGVRAHTSQELRITTMRTDRFTVQTASFGGSLAIV